MLSIKCSAFNSMGNMLGRCIGIDSHNFDLFLALGGFTVLKDAVVIMFSNMHQWKAERGSIEPDSEEERSLAASMTCLASYCGCCGRINVKDSNACFSPEGILAFTRMLYDGVLVCGTSQFIEKSLMLYINYLEFVRELYKETDIFTRTLLYENPSHRGVLFVVLIYRLLRQRSVSPQLRENGMRAIGIWSANYPRCTLPFSLNACSQWRCVCLSHLKEKRLINVTVMRHVHYSNVPAKKMKIQ
jgi:hypothetical protein